MEYPYAPQGSASPDSYTPMSAFPPPEYPDTAFTVTNASGGKMPASTRGRTNATNPVG